MQKLEEKFLAVADYVSYAMGTPANIMVWILLVLGWILAFGTGLLNSNTNLLPAWFTSNAFNFPLNTVTTLAELYIGFLVAAATNRSERFTSTLIDHTKKTIEEVKDLNTGQDDTLSYLKTEITDMQKDLSKAHRQLDELHKFLLEHVEDDTLTDK